MANIKLRIGGDSSGAERAARNAASALQQLARDADKAAQDVAKYAKQVGEAFASWVGIPLSAREVTTALLDFGKASIQAFAEAERAQKQLAMVAGEATSALEAQAGVMRDTLGVSDEMVMKMQTMLLRFGVLPGQIDETVRALLDYSAATGTDAVAATEQLLSAAKTGREAFKDLNLEYDKTGEAAERVGAISDALAKKMGGAAAVEADTLEGRTRKAAEAWDELKEAFGGFLVNVEAKTGVLDKLTKVIQGWGFVADIFEKTGVGGLIAPGVLGPDVFTAAEQVVLEEEEDRRKAAEGMAREQERAKAAAAAREQERVKAAPAAREARKRQRVSGGFELPAVFQESARMNVERLEAEAWLAKQLREEREKAFEAELAMLDEEEAKWLAKNVKTNRAIIASWKEMKSPAEEAGAAIGQAFVGALTREMDRLAAGGEFDLGAFVGDLMGTILVAAGGVLGSIVPGIGTALGASLGGLAASGVRLAMRAGTPRRHDGGWVERFHSGGWPGLGQDEVPIIAQTGEMVLSRSDVARMGGPPGVERARQQEGGGLTLVLPSALDANSFREYLEGRGGLGLVRALRTGRGPLSQVLGG